MNEIKVGSRWQGRREGGGVTVTGVYGQTVYLKSDRCEASGSREWFLLAYEPIAEVAPDPRDAEIEALRRERDKHNRRAAEWQGKVGELQPRVEGLERDLKIARQWNAAHLDTISRRPDAWTWGKCQEERDSARQALVSAQLERDALRKETEGLRTALAETDAKWRKAEENEESALSRAAIESNRAERARDLEFQVANLKSLLVVQTRERQEAQDMLVTEARARKQAEAALAGDCYACANTPAVSAEIARLKALLDVETARSRKAESERDASRRWRLDNEAVIDAAPPRALQRKVERQRVALAGIEEKNKILVEKVAAEWARAERALSERGQFLAEVQRLTPKIATLESVREALTAARRVLDTGYRGYTLWHHNPDFYRAALEACSTASEVLE